MNWTLPSLLGDMPNNTEELFAPRDMSYPILGIEFENAIPQVWYPRKRRHLIIQLQPMRNKKYNRTHSE